MLSPRCELRLILLYHYLVFFVVCLWYNQRLLVYTHGFSFLSSEYNRVQVPCVPYVVVILVTRDKVRLKCLVIPHSASTSLKGTVILFHGKAMNNGDVIDSHAVPLSKQGFTVLSAEYRGYGNSEGTPSESGLRLDAQAALDSVLEHPDLSKRPIVICGHGLGGAVAIDVASRNPDKISALIIENTYSSIPSLVGKWPMGCYYLSFLTTQKWYSVPKIAGLPAELPILMLSSLRDQFIPPSEMAELWEAAKTRPKRKTRRFGSVFAQGDEESLVTRPKKDVFQTFDYGCHYYGYLQPRYWTAIARFLDGVVPSSPIPLSASDDPLSASRFLHS